MLAMAAKKRFPFAIGLKIKRCEPRERGRLAIKGEPSAVQTKKKSPRKPQGRPSAEEDSDEVPGDEAPIPIISTGRRSLKTGGKAHPPTKRWEFSIKVELEACGRWAQSSTESQPRFG